MKIQGYCGAPRQNSDQTQTVFLQTNFTNTMQAALVKDPKQPYLIYGKAETFPEPHGYVVTVPEFPKGIFLTFPKGTPVQRNDFLQISLNPVQLPKHLTDPVQLQPDNIISQSPWKNHQKEVSRIKQGGSH